MVGYVWRMTDLVMPEKVGCTVKAVWQRCIRKNGGWKLK